MTDVCVLLIFAMIMMVLLVAYAFFSYIHTKKKHSRMKKLFKLSLQVIETRNSVYSHKESLKKYPLLNSYVTDVEVLFTDYVINIEAIKVTRVGLLNKNRQKLMREFENAPNYIKDVVRGYSRLLSNIYEYNHPYKHFFHSLRTRMTVLFLHIAIAFCRIMIFLLNCLNIVFSIGKPLRASNDVKKSVDAKTICTETYGFQVI